jgi:thiol-disulfide isomerase/thioredoxin
VLTIHCLCAAWCTTCDAFRPQFDDLQAALRAAQPDAVLRWIDVEDEADLVDPVEVETFPTLLVLRDGAPVFFGPVRPQRGAVERLLQGTEGETPGPLPAEVHALAARLSAQAR